MADEMTTDKPTAEDHTAAALHSALDACLAEDSTGAEKAKKLAKILKAMHQDKEPEEEAKDEAAETGETKTEEKTDEAVARQEQDRGFTARMEQTGPLPNPRIDREQGILRHVHIAGLVSRTDGARYAIESHRKAASRFEQMPVGLDHDYSSAPMTVAKAWGVLSNITVENDGPYGDLAYLKSHERTEQVLEDAERGTGIFSLSMVANTRGKGLDIQEYVPSRVDLVVRGATTRTLFNQDRPAAVSKEQYDALNGRFEQLQAEVKELTARVKLKEEYIAPQSRLEQQIDTTLKAASKAIDIKEFWDKSLDKSLAK